MAVEPISDRTAFDALFALHKDEPEILISNGFLEKVRDNQKLLDSLDNDEEEFFKRSVDKYEMEINLAVEAAEEGNTALIEAEQRAAELVRANAEAERQRNLADEARQEAELLAGELEVERDNLKWDLEKQKSYELIADRQKWLFTVLRKTALPAWALVFSLLVATTVLSYFDKETQAFVTILSIAVGTLLTMYATGFTSMFAPMLKDSKPKSLSKSGSQQDESSQ